MCYFCLDVDYLVEEWLLELRDAEAIMKSEDDTGLSTLEQRKNSLRVDRGAIVGLFQGTDEVEEQLFGLKLHEWLILAGRRCSQTW